MFNLKFVRENLILECPKFETYFLKKILKKLLLHRGGFNFPGNLIDMWRGIGSRLPAKSFVSQLAPS